MDTATCMPQLNGLYTGETNHEFCGRKIQSWRGIMILYLASCSSDKTFFMDSSCRWTNLLVTHIQTTYLHEVPLRDEHLFVAVLDYSSWKSWNAPKITFFQQQSEFVSFFRGNRWKQKSHAFPFWSFSTYPSITVFKILSNHILTNSSSLVCMSQNIKNLKEQYASSNHLFSPRVPVLRHASGWTPIPPLKDWASKTGSLQKMNVQPLSHIFPFCHSKTCKLLYLKHYAHSKLVLNLNRKTHAQFTHSRRQKCYMEPIQIMHYKHQRVKGTQHDQLSYTKWPSPQSASYYPLFSPQP